MSDERITTHLQYLKKNLYALEEIQKLNKTDFINDDIKVYACERLFQKSIESCINISNRILSLEQTSKPVSAPETYVDILNKLNELNLITGQQLENFSAMFRFRNRLVHVYWEIDPQNLYDYLQSRLIDFEDFISVTINYLNSRN
jgi:uncharacterized protein YutE (UPF0331/DUF86 family)